MLVDIEGRQVNITHPEKLLWPALGIRKIDYIKILLDLAPYLLPHTANRLLTTIRYPDGISGKSFFQKNIPDHSPDCCLTVYGMKTIIPAAEKAVLVWMGIRRLWSSTFLLIPMTGNSILLIWSLIWILRRTIFCLLGGSCQLVLRSLFP
jgi:hypothetical protein